uniref:Uncharacterized protein n=1 Tax=Romanomermis culicivorax TaxID=13658 RepID=A0A915HNB4_ROMCU
MTSPRPCGNPWAAGTRVAGAIPNMREIMDEEFARQLEGNSTKLAENPLDFEIAVSFEEEETPTTPLPPTTTLPLSTTTTLPLTTAPSTTTTLPLTTPLQPTTTPLPPPDFPDVDDVSNDFLLAQLLQSQFDREYDKILSLEEKKLNGNEKVQLSFQNFRRRQDGPNVDGKSSSDDDDQEDEDVKEIRNFKLDTWKAPDFGASGVIKKNDGQLVTKHDKVVCGRKNTDRVMAFPPEFQTGDAAKMDMQLTNKVFNSLKMHMKQEEKKTHRIFDKKDKATSELALDANTRIVIYKMVNSGLLESVTGVVASGKEAIVLHARGGDWYANFSSKNKSSSRPNAP